MSYEYTNTSSTLIRTITVTSKHRYFHQDDVFTGLTQNPKLCKELEYAISFSLVRRSKFQVLL